MQGLSSGVPWHDGGIVVVVVGLAVVVGGAEVEVVAGAIVVVVGSAVVVVGAPVVVVAGGRHQPSWEHSPAPSLQGAPTATRQSLPSQLMQSGLPLQQVVPQTSSRAQHHSSTQMPVASAPLVTPPSNGLHGSPGRMAMQSSPTHWTQSG